MVSHQAPSRNRITVLQLKSGLDVVDIHRRNVSPVSGNNRDQFHVLQLEDGFSEWGPAIVEFPANFFFGQTLAGFVNPEYDSVSKGFEDFLLKGAGIGYHFKMPTILIFLYAFSKVYQ